MENEKHNANLYKVNNQIRVCVYKEMHQNISKY